MLLFKDGVLNCESHVIIYKLYHCAPVIFSEKNQNFFFSRENQLSTDFQGNPKGLRTLKPDTCAAGLGVTRATINSGPRLPEALSEPATVKLHRSVELQPPHL
jgi:hypothetical protein